MLFSVSVSIRLGSGIDAPFYALADLFKYNKKDILLRHLMLASRLAGKDHSFWFQWSFHDDQSFSIWRYRLTALVFFYIFEDRKWDQWCGDEILGNQPQHRRVTQQIQWILQWHHPTFLNLLILDFIPHELRLRSSMFQENLAKLKGRVTLLESGCLGRSWH